MRRSVATPSRDATSRRRVSTIARRNIATDVEARRSTGRFPEEWVEEHGNVGRYYQDINADINTEYEMLFCLNPDVTRTKDDR